MGNPSTRLGSIVVTIYGSPPSAPTHMISKYGSRSCRSPRSSAPELRTNASFRPSRDHTTFAYRPAMVVTCRGAPPDGAMIITCPNVVSFHVVYAIHFPSGEYAGEYSR